MRTRRNFCKDLSLGITGVSLFPSLLKTSEIIKDESIKNKKGKYDLLIYGATPAGIACAVRAAREGLEVMLVSYYKKIGGILKNGLGVWDTLYEGGRSPVYDEIRQSVFQFYKNKYGENSSQYKDALPWETRHSNGTFEPKVAEFLLNSIIHNEQNIDLLTQYCPVNVETEENLIKSIEFINNKKNIKLSLKATIYADCTYEGDLLALTGLPYRIGRESRDEYNEPHAGIIYIRNLNEIKFDKGLDLRQFGNHQALIYPESTGEGDDNVQAFNMRTILTSDPINRIDITKPGKYNANDVKDLEYDSIIRLPNNKICWNRPQLIGLQNKYINGDWIARNEVINAHRNAVINKLYFLQNDSSVPDNVQKYWKQFGLPKDEFVDNGNMPYEIYVREGRRLVGEYIMNQFDLMPKQGQVRTPIKYDSIGITDWYMDSHACTASRTRDSMHEGKMMLYYDTYPGQVPFRSLYNKQIRNFLVPVCLSCTHVAWGAIRLEPTWMNIAESAALAAKMMVNEKKYLDTLDIDKLQIEISGKKIMIGFFNDFDIHSGSPLSSAIQYFSTKGFFKNYQVEKNIVIDENTAKQWIEILSVIINKAENIEEKIANLSVQPLKTSIVSSEKFNELMKLYGLNININISSDNLKKEQILLFFYDIIKNHFS